MAYSTEIYDEKEFKKKFPKAAKICGKKLAGEEYEFSQALAIYPTINREAPLDVSYDLGDRMADFSFDGNEDLIHYEESTD